MGDARRTETPRRSGGSDSGSVRKASSRFSVDSPAATSGGNIPGRPWIREARQLAADVRPEDEAQAEGDSDGAHSASAILGRW